MSKAQLSKSDKTMLTKAGRKAIKKADKKPGKKTKTANRSDLLLVSSPNSDR